MVLRASAFQPFMTLALLLVLPNLWAATPVKTEALGALLFFPQHSAPAEVLSLNDSQLSAELMARIEAIPVQVGDRVKAGDLLVRLDCRSAQVEQAAAQAALDELQVQLGLADSQLQRALRLRQQRNLSDEELERRQAEQQGLTARRAGVQQQLQQAALQVERCQVLAPFAGVVRERLAQLGELTSPGKTLIRLQQLEPAEVSALLPPGQPLQEAQQLRYQDDSGSYALALRTELPLLDARTRNREVRLVFVDAVAQPGSSGRLRWQEREPRLPADLLLRREGQLGVMLAVAGRAHFEPLPQAEEGQPVRVVLPADSRLITAGRHSVSEGDAVVETVVEKVVEKVVETDVAAGVAGHTTSPTALAKPQSP